MKAPYVRAAMRLPGLGPGERLVLAYLADMASDSKRQAFPSRETMCDDLGMPSKTVQRHLSTLRRYGYIEQTATARPGRTLTHTLRPDAWPNRPDP